MIIALCIIAWIGAGMLGLWNINRRWGRGPWYWPAYRPINGWFCAVISGPFLLAVSVA